MEKINHPEHYKGNKYEAIDIIDDYQLGFNLGNAVKYILRAGKKGDALEDLKKAKWYIEHEICKLMNEQERKKEKEQVDKQTCFMRKCMQQAKHRKKRLNPSVALSANGTEQRIAGWLIGCSKAQTYAIILVVRGRRKNEIPHSRKHNDKQSKRADGNCT